MIDLRDDELIIDNFAGGGGASTAILMATGRHPDIAINHDAEALAMHAANHPTTRHLCEDVFAVDPVKECAGRPVGLAWFSPDCKHFSKAKGGQPKSKKIRGLAWVMVKWAATVRPRVMFLENVEEFQTWGPLLPDGKACPRRKGKTFLGFIARLRNLGYAVEWQQLRASDHGAGTIRKRLFMVARCDGFPITWPKASHGRVRSGELKHWTTAADSIDWSIPCPSIFDRTRPLADATMRRIARGVWKFVINSAEPFIVKVNHTAAGYDQFRGQSLDEPLQTITGKHGYGIAVPHVTKFRTGATGSEVTEPMPTITAGPKENPAGAAHALGLVAATLVQTGYGEREGQQPRVPGLEKPLGTIVNGQKHAAVAALLTKHYGGNETPGSPLDRPVDTITSTDHNALTAVNLVRHFGQSIGGEAGEPVGTITAGGMGKTAVSVSHLSKLYGTTTGQDVREPLHTVTGGGNHIAEVRAFLIKYYGSGGQDQSIKEPLHTITAKDRVGLVTIHGEEYVITDIGMRMLEPHELFKAQGFPESYIIAPKVPRKVGKRNVMRPLPKHAQVRMCGNSVSPPPAAALIRANFTQPVADEIAA